MSTTLPRQLLTSNTRRLLVPYGMNVTQTLRVDITVKKLLAFGPNLGLTFQYREMRVHNVRVYWQTMEHLILDQFV